MQQIGSGANSLVTSFKSMVPAIRERKGFPKFVQLMCLANVGFFAYYTLSSGPTQSRLRRNFTVTPESSKLSLATFHFAHTNPVPLAINTAVLLGTGLSHINKFGQGSFMRVFGLGCVAASVAVSADAYYNRNQT